MIGITIILIQLLISNNSDICKPEEGWYGQQPKYCYEKTIHVVLISFAVVFGFLFFKLGRPAYDIRSHRSNWEIHKHCIVNGVSHWKWQVSVRIKTGSVCSYCSLLQLKLGEVISQGNRKVGSFCRYRITKESKESNKRFLLGTLLFGCIVSFVVRNRCLGTHGSTEKSWSFSKLSFRTTSHFYKGRSLLHSIMLQRVYSSK